MFDLNQIFLQAIAKGASDVHLIAGERPIMRIYGLLKDLDPKAPIINNDELTKAAFTLLNKEKIERFENEWDLDLAHQVDSTRFRINLHYQLGQIALSARVVPKDIPEPEFIGLEDKLYELTHLNKGFILVTGPSGSGKSTTLAVMINIINMERRAHIITLEDPIEFIYPKKNSVIEQREVGRDTKSFYSGLKYALRQDPNVILIGEMRDPETMAAALTAAETGHLVFSTLHTNSAAETLERIVDSFDSERQHQILIQLAGALAAVVTQQLVPTVDDKIAVAREIMVNNAAVSNLIRQNKTAHIPSVIQTSKAEGMISMNNSLKNLLNKGIISKQVYQNRSLNAERVGTYF
ncbi:MAG: PilT/PilU family type 4a pilus ATPase [Patescibacteria group bacterium]